MGKYIDYKLDTPDKIMLALIAIFLFLGICGVFAL